jgi:ectoine hydroxylase-related dioxygenase (phytanoyl-CoA dioxygenase family)
MLTNPQLSAYRSDGYLVVEGVLTDQEIAELVQATDDFVDRARNLTKSDDVLDLEPNHEPDAPRVRRIHKPYVNHPVYEAIAKHEAILDIVSQLVGPSIRLIGGKLNMKAAEGGSPVEWHQDWAFMPFTNDDLLTVGVAIDDVRQDNGCLIVIPGSHLEPIYDHHQEGVFVGAVTESRIDVKRALPVEVSPGAISIHHFRLLHASARNTSGRSRRLLLTEYAAGDAWPLMGVSDWSGFNNDLVRGSATVEPRLSPVPVRIPLPGRARNIYEIQQAFKA